MLIFGLTGTHSSGKGEVGKYFVSKGFRYYSCSDELRKEAKRLGLEETRENLGIVIGDRLRIEFGKGVLGKRIYDQILKDKIELAVVDSLRLIEEVNELRKNKNFYLIFVDAPIEERYKRSLERKRATDNLSFEEFKKDSVKYGYHIGMEGGYMDTLVLDGPLFNKSLEITSSNKIFESEYNGYVKINSYNILEKKTQVLIS